MPFEFHCHSIHSMDWLMGKSTGNHCLHQSVDTCTSWRHDYVRTIHICYHVELVWRCSNFDYKYTNEFDIGTITIYYLLPFKMVKSVKTSGPHQLRSNSSSRSSLKRWRHCPGIRPGTRGNCPPTPHVPWVGPTAANPVTDPPDRHHFKIFPKRKMSGKCMLRPV